jgi:TM2 domain-containing membrane protein YozV
MDYSTESQIRDGGWLLGFLGVDRFSLGKVGTGILKLLTLGALGSGGSST